MNKRRYSNRRRKNILRVFILLMTIIITVVMWRTIKIDVQVGELTLPKILQSEKSFADTSGEWNLILVDRNHYIPLFVAYNSSSFFTSNSFIKSSFALPIRYFTRESLI